MTPGDWEKFRVDKVAGTNDLFTIKTAFNQYWGVNYDYVSLRANVSTPKGWEHFQFEQAANGMIYIYSPAHTCWWSANSAVGRVSCQKDKTKATPMMGWYQPNQFIGKEPWRMY